MSLNVDISSVDVAILSHGHYDHGGGALHFLEMNKTSPLYINKNSFCDFFSKNGYIGLNKELSSNPRVVQTECKTNIYPLIMGDEFSVETIEELSEELSKKDDEGKSLNQYFVEPQYYQEAV
jgi:metal-dependent hydrolase (beta-lactamase superfamily II)